MSEQILYKMSPLPAWVKPWVIPALVFVAGCLAVVVMQPNFALIWKELPRFRWLAALFRAPFLAWLLDKAYGVFLMLRPFLQAMASREGVWSSRR